MKKTTVSIGIPAYNEEANIGKLLESLLKQKQENFTLKEIVVVSDQSSDKTDEIVKGFASQKIKLFRNKRRSGQAASQNRLKKYCKEDIVVLINADMLIEDKYFLKKLISPMIKNSKIGIACPRIIPIKPRGYFEKIIYGSVLVKTKTFENWRNGNNLYTCRGAARAFRKELIKQITWPILTGEDSFTYFTCITHNYLFKFVPKSVIYYRLPTNFKDHQKQSLRFLGTKKNYLLLFNQELVKKEYKPPMLLLLKNFLNFVVNQPLEALLYIDILVLVRIIPAKKPTAIWQPSISTKTI